MSNTSTHRKKPLFEKRSINIETLEHDKIAAGQRLAANALSMGRAVMGAVIMGYAINTERYQSTSLALSVGAATASDVIDGYLARRAANRLKPKTTNLVLVEAEQPKVSTTRFGKWVDQMSDKAFTHTLFWGFGLSEIIHGNPMQKLYGSTLIAADSYMLWRDTRATQTRVELEKQQKEVKARNAGKVKMAIGMATLALAASPLTESGNWEAAVVVGTLGTAALAAYSLHDLRNQLDPDFVYSPLRLLPPLDEAV